MKHIFNTLLSLVTICLPGCIFAQNFPFPDWMAPYKAPHEVFTSVVQERNEVPVLLMDSLHCVDSYYPTGQIYHKNSVWNEYNAEGNAITSTSYTKDQSNVETTTRLTSFYNSNATIAFVVVENKNGANWVLKERISYTYDNTQIELKIENYITGGISRYVFIKNADGDFVETRNESLINNVWKLSSKTTIASNADNYVEIYKVESYNLQTGELFNGYQNISEYDAAGNKTLNITQNWNKNTMQWVNSSKDVSTYTTNNLLATKELSNPSTVNPAVWELFSRTEKTYVNQIELDSVLDFKWSGNNWQPTSLTLHQYANGQLIKDSSYNWSANLWELAGRNLHKPADDIYSIAFGLTEGTETQYYNNGTWITNAFFQREYSDLGNNRAKMEYLNKSFNDLNQINALNNCNFYYHRKSPVSTNEALTNQSTTLAPNPYKIGQTIRCIGLENSTDLTFSLYDIAGALISEQTFDGGTGLVLPAKVKAGMYIALISQGAQRLKTTKIVVVDAP